MFVKGVALLLEGIVGECMFLKINIINQIKILIMGN